MKNNLVDAINDQIQAEFYSAYLYLSMMSYFVENNLDGFATYMKVQSDEEMLHANKLITYLHDRGGHVELKALQKPLSDFKSILDVFTKAFKHEQGVSKRINNLYDLAKDENDHHMQVMLHWFIDEQTEEEQTAKKMVDTVAMLGESRSGLYMFSKEAAVMHVQASLEK